MPTQTFTPKKRQNPAWHTARVHGDSFEQKGRIRHCIVKNQLGPRLGPVAGHTSWASDSFQMQTIISHNVDARVRGPVNPLPRVCQQRPRGSFIRLTETVGPCTPSAHASQPDHAGSDPDTDRKKAPRQTLMRDAIPTARPHTHAHRRMEKRGSKTTSRQHAPATGNQAHVRCGRIAGE